MSTRNVFRTIALLGLVGFSTPAIAQRAPTPPPPDPSLHLYRETTDGGVVIVVDHDATRQALGTIRAQMRAEAKAFARGDYDTPPGAPPSSIAALRSGAERISVTYTDIEDGGAITFRSSDRPLVRAIYAYFGAEVAAQRRAHPLGGPGDI